MSSADNAWMARRPLLKGLFAAGGILVAAAASFEVPRFFARHYPPTPFDDLFALLADRDSAARLGAVAVEKRMRPAALAQLLRGRIGGHSLVTVLDGDLARAQLAEAHGWVLPETLVLLCALAAQNGD